MKKRILAAGYFGCGNLGDDALLVALRDGMEPMGYELNALSGNPEATRRHLGIPSYPRKDFAAVARAIEENDSLVFPGGSIFQDVTSSRSAMYYGKLVSMAKSKGRSVIMVGQGVGPLKTFFGRRAALAAFNAADAIAVRDPDSAKTLRELGVLRPVKVTADLALALLPPRSDETSAFQVGGMRTVGLAPRPHGKGKEIAELFGEVARLLMQASVVPMLIEMDTEMDAPLLDAIEKAQGGKVPGIRRIAHPVDLQRRIARMDAVVAMRLHAGILASTVGVPSLMVSYDPKVGAFAREANLPLLEANQLKPQRIVDAVLAQLKERDAAAARLTERMVSLRTRALENFQIIHEVLSR